MTSNPNHSDPVTVTARVEAVDAAVRRYRRAQRADGWPVAREAWAEREGLERSTRKALGE